MLQRGAGRLAVVLEQHDVAEADVFLQVVDAIAERPQHFLDLPLGHLRHGQAVIGALDDHLVRADAVHLVVHAFALAVQLAFDAQRRKLVGHHAHAPSRLVRAAAGAVGQHFGRGLLLVAVAEGAKARGGRRHRLADEIGGAARAVGRDDYPAARDRVLT